MSEFIVHDSVLKAHMSRWRDWTSTVMEDLQSISVTRISIPFVMVISAIMLGIGVLSTVVWSASAKSTTLEQVISTEASLQQDIKTLQQTEREQIDGMVELKATVAAFGKQLDTLTIQQESLTQLLFQRQERQGKQ
jgi:hypothetical protein